MEFSFHFTPCAQLHSPREFAILCPTGRRHGYRRECRMKGYILEACVDSAESAGEGQKGGANRLELGGNLGVGGGAA